MSERAAEHNYRMALMFYRTERYEDAIAILDDLALEFPDSKHVLYALTKCFFKVGRFQEARELCHELITKHNDERAETLLKRMGDRKDTYKPRSAPHETPPDLPVGAATDGAEDHDSPADISTPPDDTTSSWMTSTPTGLFSGGESEKDQASEETSSSPPAEHPSPFSTPPPLEPEKPLITPPPLTKEENIQEEEKKATAEDSRESSSAGRNMLIAAGVIGAVAVVLWLAFGPRQFVFPENHSLGMLVIREISGSKIKWADYHEAKGQVSIPKRAYIGLKASKELSEADLVLLRKASWLKYLNLSQSKITDEMVEHLAGLQQVKKMDVRGTDLTEAGVTRLREWLPKCTILSNVNASA